MSLRRQFVLSLTAFSVAVAAAFGLLSWRVASDALEEELERRLEWFAGGAEATSGLPGSLLAFFRPGDEDEVEWDAYQARLMAMTDRYVSDAFIFNAADSLSYGAIVTTASKDSVPIGQPLRHLEAYRTEINQALEDGFASTRRFVGPGGQWYKLGFFHLRETELAEPPPIVVGLQIPADFFEPLAALSRFLLWGSIGAILVAVLLGGYLAVNVAQPLERLSRAARRIQRGHMERPIEAEPGEELGRLSEAMERMREGIVERDEQLRLMLAQVAHEIRNPLGGLELFASAVAETPDPAERIRLMQRVRGEIDALNQIINDFLTFARPIHARRQGEDLRKPIGDAVELVSPELEQRGKVLEVHLPHERLMAVVDADQVKRSVLNLIRNGADAGDRVRVTAQRERTAIVIRVMDDGPGVPDEMRERIFEPFITDKEQGAGLGLAIVRKVVEAHGGRVEVGTSEDEIFGNGAEFRLYFIGLEEPPDVGGREREPSEPAAAHEVAEART